MEQADTTLGDLSAAGTDVPAVELVSITKAFPGVVANDGIDLTLRRGEVHCLLGENGAGKSTLMSILAGMAQPDSGRIVVDGATVRIASPRRALDLGIGMVYQHTTLVPTLSVLENLMLGAGDGIRLDVRGARARFDDLAATLGVSLDPDAETGTLALGQQQQVEIVRALWRGSRVLILDEPTSMLTPQGVAELAKVLVRLKGSGLAVVFITHKLHEAVEMGDRVSVLRRGHVVGRLGPDALRGRSTDEIHDAIVTLMFGADGSPAAGVSELQAHVEGHPGRKITGEPILEIADLHVAPGAGEVGIRGLTLSVRPGEVMGVAGVDGNGQRELAEALAGQRRATSGGILFAGVSIARLSVSRRQRLGIRYVTDDRLGEGTVAALPVSLNIVLKRIGQAPFWQRGSIRRGAIDRTARDLIERFDIRTPGPRARTGTLSGGNIQKVVLARELSFEPRFVIYNKPTYGLDLRTTKAVRDRIREHAAKGVGAIVISTDLDEIVELADRIAVLSRGRLAGVVENGEGAGARVGELMVGGGAESSVEAPA